MKKESMQTKLVESFLDSLELHKRHYYVDFESIRPVIPIFDGTKPYQQLCFQFCLVTMQNNQAKEEVCNFVEEPGVDPRKRFIKELLERTKLPGNIIVYNATYEKTRLKEFAEAFPELEVEIEDRISRIKDLMEPFQKKLYYHPKFKGGYSLKDVMPVLGGDFKYDKLQIQNGDMATMAYQKMAVQSKNERLITKVALIEYCQVDTLGMKVIIESLYQKIKGRTE